MTILVCCCSSNSKLESSPIKEDFTITSITIPAEISAKNGEIIQCWAKGILESDTIILEGENQKYETDVISVTETKFSFAIPEKLTSDVFRLYVKREGKLKKLGVTNISIIIEAEIPDKEGMNVKGIVHSGGFPLQGVQVSDGYEITMTDKNGVYYLNSRKKHGYIFVTIPSGYEAMRSGIIPRFFQYFKQSEHTTERFDFELKKVDQSEYRLFVLGDIHLANRGNKDRFQFKNFVLDINPIIKNANVPVYGLTLGDMTWDTYWYNNGYLFNNYVEDMNQVKNLAIFHTIGNHDHELGKPGAYPVGDFETVIKYKANLGPTYYSINIGDVHYVILDDIFCTNDGSGVSSYKKLIDTDQISWLKKDLSNVDKNKTILCTMHCPLHKKDGEEAIENYDVLIDCFKGFPKVHFFTGHTHVIYNIDKGKYMEHNAGAICATWWWTGYKADIHISQDGAPGGYTIVDFKGDDLKWRFKGTGRDLDYQFRTYDRNSIHITSDKYCPEATAEEKRKFDGYTSWWKTKNADNEVFINVWNWDPQWKIEVKENGKSLDVQQITMKDPLHLISYTATCIAHPSFATNEWSHFFKVQASSPTSTLDIKVTDRFGNIYEEEMKRPKSFSINEYK